MFSSEKTFDCRLSSALIVALVVGFIKAAPSDIQPANQIPNMPTSLSSISSGSVEGGPASSMAPKQPQQALATSSQKLPKINIYISNSQIKKLLGKF